MNSEQLDAILSKAANRDMGIARRRGALIITETKLGNIDVTYDALLSKRYSVSNINTGAWLLVAADASTTRSFLKNAYVVEL